MGQTEALLLSLLQRVNPPVFQQPSTTERTGQRCPGISNWTRAVERDEDGAIVQHQVLSRATGSDFIASLATPRTRDNSVSRVGLVHHVLLQFERSSEPCRLTWPCPNSIAC